MPKQGDELATPRGQKAQWRHIVAGSGGTFTGLGNGYLAASVVVEKDGPMLLEAAGHSLVYVNGIPRGGDPYSYGYLKLPVMLHKGENTLLFVVGRGQLSARLSPVRAPIQIETGDLTTPDIVVGGPETLWAGVVLVNSTDKVQHVNVIARNSAQETKAVAAEIPAMSLRKVPVQLPIVTSDLSKEQKFQLECTESGVTDKANITLAVKKPTETHKETFISGIDGSLQYYGVNPSQKPSNKDALILSLHGASVEGIGQASAYSNKDWCTLVAATNRRPYGFDWEDIGRLDALEVLDIAKKRFRHDPASIHLTGHSMGGHGTWSIGTLYPNLFASIAPSAGWISFFSYAGGYQPTKPNEVESILLRAVSPSDTLARVTNTLEEKVYILHGDKDDNVPVDEAREMKRVLTSIHADFEYHEEPGAGHWWGSPCVDWPGIFTQIRGSRLAPKRSIDFTTPNPAVSATDDWIKILEQVHPMKPSRIRATQPDGTNDAEIKTENIEALKIGKNLNSLKLDGQTFGRIKQGTELFLHESKWQTGRLKDGAKSPELSGPFKNVYQNRFAFIVGTHGTPEENAWAANKARYDAETFQYRGNGAVDIVLDTQYDAGSQRNAILYGNADTNSAWKGLLGSSPIQVKRGRVNVGSKVIEGNDLASLFVYPHKAHGKWILVGAITGTGIEGFKTTDRLALFSSGVAYPDWIVMGANILSQGAKGIRACGFFDNEWRVADGESAWTK